MTRVSMHNTIALARPLSEAYCDPCVGPSCGPIFAVCNLAAPLRGHTIARNGTEWRTT
ncbi:hypothetical protein DAEQUDRAFT_727225 [Daedalea quercina L-15889]|uniref:Uncharacterized protein n=1 Tax=Daedalea quercina L-15889 TaxID=1314783 RepID=A0A165Q5M0_9APHY|nr:hypothetical protein DAEQUDRAFT_727225 [Daedalea quercina L-15889]